MRSLSTARAIFDIWRASRLDTDQLRTLQERKLLRLVRHAHDTVPYYRALFARARLRPDDIRTLDDLVHIPVTTKADLQAAGPESIISSNFPSGSLVRRRTSGSTGRPFTVHFDRRFWRIRKFHFLRALLDTGYVPGQRLMLIAEPRRSRRWVRWHHVSMEESAEHVAAELNRVRPRVLYGFVTPLRQLAKYLRESGRQVHQPEVVVSTAECLDSTTRRLLEEVFSSSVYSFYGMTEMGLIAWECPAHAGAHISEETCLLEALPVRASQSAPRLILTNLELLGAPLLRFETGDLGELAPPGRCACGRSLRRIARVEGRLVDCVRLRGGQELSPYFLTCALEHTPGVQRYQVIQHDIDLFTFRWEGTNTDDALVETCVRRVLVDLLGTEVKVDCKHELRVEPTPGRKFRVVECRVGTKQGR